MRLVPSRTHRIWAAGQLGAVCLGCSSQVIPDPQTTVDRYVEAAEKGDSDAIYGLLTQESRQARGKAKVRQLVEESDAELKRQAKAIRSKGTKIEAEASVRFVDGEVARFSIEDGRFRIEAAAALPARASTPGAALAEFRAVLARRSYAGLIRVLSPDARAALEERLRSLVEGLEQPDALNIEVEGDTATVKVPGGHSVVLKREAGIWKVQDFN